MTAKEIEDAITFKEYGTDDKTNSVLFKATFTIEYFGRISNAEIQTHGDLYELRGKIIRHTKETLMRKLYDDQREKLYSAIYDLRAANPMDISALLNAQNALLSAAMRQQPKVE